MSGTFGGRYQIRVKELGENGTVRNLGCGHGCQAFVQVVDCELNQIVLEMCEVHGEMMVKAILETLDVRARASCALT